MSLMELAQLLGDLGEFFGAIVVTVTLIFLATQLRQSTRALELNQRIVLAQNHQERAYRWCNRMELLADSTAIASVLVKAERAGFPHDEAYREVLDEVELRRLWAWEIAQREQMENVAFQERAGFHRFEDTESWHRTLAQNAPRWAALNISIRDPEFRRLVEDARRTFSD